MWVFCPASSIPLIQLMCDLCCSLFLWPKVLTPSLPTCAILGLVYSHIPFCFLHLCEMLIRTWWLSIYYQYIINVGRFLVFISVSNLKTINQCLLCADITCILKGLGGKGIESYFHVTGQNECTRGKSPVPNVCIGYCVHPVVQQWGFLFAFTASGERKKNSHHLNEEKRSKIIQFNICIMQSQNDGRDAMKKENNC